MEPSPSASSSSASSSASSSPSSSTQFLYATCKPGAEVALIQEMEHELDDARPAFRRPGIVTFKLGKAQSVFGKSPLGRSIYAERYGVSLERVAGEDEGRLRRDALQALATLPWPAPPHLSAWVRPADGADENLALAATQSAVLTAELEALAGELGLPFTPGPPAYGAWVFDILSVDAGALMLGAHRHTDDILLTPPSLLTPAPSAEPPSRAYGKLRDLLAFSRTEIHAGETAVEIGVSPGGAALALIEMGVRVVGIDAAEIDARLKKLPATSFRHLKKTVAAVERHELPPSFDWLLVDVNAAPKVAVELLEIVIGRSAKPKRGILATFKLSEWRFTGAVVKSLGRLEDLGFSVRAKHLPSHHIEVGVVALAGKAPRRKKDRP